MKELKMKHIASYLPYKLEIYWYNTPTEFDIVELDSFIIQCDNNKLDNIKPILKPLSDLDKSYSVKFGYVSLDDLIRSIEFEHCPIKIWDELLSEHFDVFGLIDKGLAIDKNTLN